MISLIKGQSGACALLLSLLFVHSTAGQLVGDQCFAQFKKGRQDFVLDADDSVKAGATVISSPKLNRYRDCLQACCKDSRCNVAFMERGEQEGTISSCFLFDCLYKQRYVCRFVSRKGYDSYIQDKVYDSYHVADTNPDEDDRRPVADGGPDQVVQPQDSLTLNGIQSRDDKKIVSFKWKMLTEYPYAVYEDGIGEDQIIVSNLTSGKYKFQLTVTDTIGQSDSVYVSVLVLTPEQSGHHCMAPKKVGPCRGSFPRWHYNGASEKCEKFIFGGCKENLNNYLSENECIKACHNSEKHGATGRGLQLPKEKCGAPCTAQQFTCGNGCCLDPGLECDSTPQCSDGSDELSCESLTNKFEILLQIPVDEKKVHCTEHPDTGDCRDSITQWYYSPYDTTCVRFNYGGCRGNENRFDSEESCMTYCHGVTENDVFIRSKQEAQSSDTQTGILALAIVLGVAIVIVLAILSYRLLKSRKSSQHQRLPVSNATLTSMDTDRLVYNTTTKPI